MNLYKNFLFVLFTLVISGNLNSQNALNFDGTNDYVNLGNSSSINITGTALTMEAWIYPTSWKSQVWQGNIISKESAVGTGYMLRAGSGGRLNINIGSGGPWNELTSSSAVLTLNTWQHVAATYDGSYLRLYVNGVLTDSLSKTVSIVGTVSNNLYLGESPAYPGRYFPGAVDEVRIWNVTRTKAEIVADMNKEICNIPSSLKGYYTCNQGIPSGTNTGVTVLNDASGNGNNGILTNFSLSGSTSNWVSGTTVTPGVRTTLFTDTVCSSYTTPSGRIINTTGVTADTLSSALGCDSLLVFDITISSVDDSVYRVGPRITSIDTWADHQWVRCDSGFAPIVGENNRFIIANQPGDYAVIVGRGNCKDTSECVSISLTSITEHHPLSKVFIYPNPVMDVLKIEAQFSLKEITIYSLNGTLLSRQQLENNQLNCQWLNPGIYIAEINFGIKKTRIKFVKQ